MISFHPFIHHKSVYTHFPDKPQRLALIILMYVFQQLSGIHFQSPYTFLGEGCAVLMDFHGALLTFILSVLINA